MAYFLKKTKRKQGLYLQIYESFHDPELHHSRHRCVKTIGYEVKLKAQGIDDPVDHFTKEVAKMNKQRKAEIEIAKTKTIGDSPVKNIGQFIPLALLNKLGIRRELAPYKLVRDFKFDIYEMLEALICSRIVNPLSKYKTWSEIIPTLYKTYGFSLDQIYTACEFFGEEYERLIEVFNHQIKKIYKRKTKEVYFDCTNFYFEIDCENGIKMKGPSKENRTDPIVSMALMLDEDQVPLGMKIFPGNESEKPRLRDMVKDLKKQNSIQGKTIQVADKGLNCGQNIYDALKNGDGYIFSKSVKMLPQIEKDWVLLDNSDWIEVTDTEGNLSFRYKYCIDDFSYTFTDNDGFVRTEKIPEIRIVTFNPSLAGKQKREIERLADKAACLTRSKAKKNEFGESSKYVVFSSVDTSTGELSDGSDVIAVIDSKKIEEDKKLAGYNLLVSSELKAKPTNIYNIYHNLWKIEESFRIMKGQLDARPVYVQKRDTVIGHFLIVYLAVTVLRLLQYKEFKDKFCCNDILSFIRDFKCVADDNSLINISSLKKVAPFEDLLKLGLTRYYFTEKDLKKLMNFAF